MAVLVLGIGNPVLGDDGVGWRVAEAARESLDREGIGAEVDCLDAGGLRLMERMLGYDRVVVADALTTGLRRPGDVTVFALEDLAGPPPGHTASAHDASLRTALDAARVLRAEVPQEVTIVGIEVEAGYEFSESLSPAVAAAVPAAARAVVEEVRGHAGLK